MLYFLAPSPTPRRFANFRLARESSANPRAAHPPATDGPKFPSRPPGSRLGSGNVWGCGEKCEKYRKLKDRFWQ